MAKPGLHGLNIAACAAAAAEVTYASGASALISGALSWSTLRDDLSTEERTLAREMAKGLAEHLAQTHLKEDRKRLVVQLVSDHPPSNEIAVANGEDAEKVGDAMVQHLRDNVTDPGQINPAVLSDYKAALVALLTPVLTAKDRAEAREQEILRTVHELRELAQTSGRSDSLLNEGITENAIIRLAERIAGKVDDLGQAWIELQNAMEIAVQVQREGRTPSNHGDFVDAVLARVAELAAEGDYAGAGDAVESALAEEDAAHQAKKSRLLDSGVEVAMLRGDAATAADYLIRKADLDAGGRASFEALRALQESYHETGRDKGIALDLEIAIALARLIHARGSTADERGTALNDLAASLNVLGERESGTARLEEAVIAFRAALEELTHERVPLDWASAQMNLGNALRILGERENGTARLEEAVTAFRAALEEWTRERVPLEWATTQMNLGNALRVLGERESGTARLEEAVTAYRAALEENTRDRMPLEWAKVQANLAGLEVAFFDKTSDAAHLDRAEDHARAAQEEFEAAQAGQYGGIVEAILAAIAARRSAG